MQRCLKTEEPWPRSLEQGVRKILRLGELEHTHLLGKSLAAGSII